MTLYPIGNDININVIDSLLLDEDGGMLNGPLGSGKLCIPHLGR